MSYTFLFPGQGAQYPGMGKDLYDANESVKELFKRGNEHVPFKLEEVIFDGTEEDLRATDKTQVAVTITSLAASLALRERGIQADRAAGFSLGEYAALAEAGVVAAEDVLPLVKVRGEVMEAASRELDSDAGRAGMIAVIGLDLETIRKTLQDNNFTDAYPSMANSPVQTVISGTAEGLERAGNLLKEAGAKRVIPLKVSGPFHTPLMENARSEFEKAVRNVTFNDPRIPVYSNVTGDLVTSGDEAKELCLKQLLNTVLWTAEEESLLRDGPGRLIEVGPGTVLAGLWKAFSKGRDNVEASVEPAGTLEQIEAIA
ncbi:MAG: ACP S-malonyltransferase [Spirochaetes bacterium]|nr:ACP S-malonyltransferase [Spirochaetota bacterium]